MYLFDALVQIVISISVFLIPLGVLLGVVFLIITLKTSDATKKSKFKKITLWSFFGPAALMIIVMIVWGLVKILSGTYLIK